MAKVTVITSIYETPFGFLEKSLRSLLEQTLDDIEYIWIDNGCSAECTANILKFVTLRDNIRYIRLDTNIGYDGAMNKGLLVATGEYIGFCDSDDWVDKDYFEKMYVKAIESQSDMVFCEYKWEYPNRTEISKHRCAIDMARTLEEKIKVLKNGAVWDKLFNTDMLRRNKICFPTHLKSYYVDNLFLFECIKYTNKISLIEDCYYHFYQNDGSTMKGKKGLPDRIRSRILAIEDILGFAGSTGSKAEKIECIKFLIRSLNFIEDLKREEVFRYLCEIVSNDKFLIEELTNIYRTHNPSSIDKILSLKNDRKKLYLWLLGRKIKLHRWKEH